MYCSKCGSRISNKDNYCIGCGIALKKENYEDTSVYKQDYIFIGLAGLAIVLVLVLIILFFGVTKSVQSSDNEQLTCKNVNFIFGYEQNIGIPCDKIYLCKKGCDLVLYDLAVHS